MSDETTGLAQSVQFRLVRHAKATGLDPNGVLVRFALERFLYRLSRSPRAEQFVLKGALLMLVWFGETIRPTRDADVLGIGDLPVDSLAPLFSSVCDVDVEPDGMRYLASSVRVSPIRREDAYGGRRVTVDGRLGAARLKVQVDVGIGDSVVPEPEWLDYPSLLDFPSPRLRTYRPETAVAEKLHAMVELGSKNSRMRDFFDLYMLAESERVDLGLLASAVAATFGCRRTPIPSAVPLALTPEFAQGEEKQIQWQAFLKKNALTSVPEGFGEVTEKLARFLVPAIEAATQEEGR